MMARLHWIIALLLPVAVVAVALAGRQRGPPRCVLHVGPARTGTTSLQAVLHQHRATLLADGVHQATTFTVAERNPLTDFFPNFPPGKYLAALLFAVGSCGEGTTNCHLLHQIYRPWWLALRRWLDRQAAEGRDVVLSAEGLSDPLTNISLLAAVLRPFRTTVVVGYRPAFDWLLSAQRAQLVFKNGALNGATIGILSTDPTLPAFTNAVAHRYSAHFDDIRILPLGLAGQVAAAEKFVCAILSATRTCRSMRGRTPIWANNGSRMVSARAPRGAAAAAGGGGAGVPVCPDDSDFERMLESTVASAEGVRHLYPAAGIEPTNRTALRLRLQHLKDTAAFCKCATT